MDTLLLKKGRSLRATYRIMWKQARIESFFAQNIVASCWVAICVPFENRVAFVVSPESSQKELHIFLYTALSIGIGL